MDEEEPSSPAVLSSSESWALLRDSPVGRLAVIVDGGPEIFPVNFIVDHGSVVFRTAPGSKLTACIDQRVAFEVDSYEVADGQAWSVVVKGVADEVTKMYELLDALDLPLFPWHAAPKPRIVRIEPDTISGRRFHVTEHASREWTPPRRAAPE